MTKRSGLFILGGLLVALLLAGVVSNFASAHPDGLDSTLRKGCVFDADDTIVGGSCPAQQAREHELADSPLADYGVRGVDNTYLSTGLAGALGVLLTFAVGGGLFWLTRRRPTAGPAGSAASGDAAGPAGSATPAPGQRSDDMSATADGRP
ncbi:PDGLE domain-containing protein [Micromonospora sp. HM5-17]|uniref:PDGLE domain-containing protein n=1 Tax=Micromonospora sp. HM5-17 TaxID=2487710 RepID=UPI000F4892C2|nr:PDGLE domain-containing protein [Micromonospora sp. HM5-17]ROT31752.1 cobalamin biosynthesis protein CbiM [Micromonospora sp. HM5-17]